MNDHYTYKDMILGGADILEYSQVRPSHKNCCGTHGACFYTLNSSKKKPIGLSSYITHYLVGSGFFYWGSEAQRLIHVSTS